jgi:hypothetical protein
LALCLGVITLAWAQIPMIPGLMTAPAKGTAAPSTPAPGTSAPGGATAPSAIPPEKPPAAIPVGEILQRAENRHVPPLVDVDPRDARIQSRCPC